jgi:hypothetical protein
MQDLIQPDSREPYLETPDLCWYCGDPAPDPVVFCGRTFCSRECAKDYGE